MGMEPINSITSMQAQTMVRPVTPPKVTNETAEGTAEQVTVPKLDNNTVAVAKTQNGNGKNGYENQEHCSWSRYWRRHLRRWRGGGGMAEGLVYPRNRGAWCRRDRAKADGRTNLGGDIMIHGKAVTIGCVPVGDDAIEDIFYLASAVGIKNVSVVIAPYDMRKGRSPELERTSIKWYPNLCNEIHTALSGKL